MTTVGPLNVAKDRSAKGKRQTAVTRLIRQCYLEVQAAELLNIHREIVSIYVQKFNQGGMDALLERHYAPGRKAVSVSRRRM